MSGDQTGKPPRNRGQFPPGVSGNLRGRPRKGERSYTYRQMRQDFLGLMEEPIPVKIGGRSRPLPAIQGVYLKMLQTALEGDRQMMIKVVDLRREFISELAQEHGDEIKMLEQAEKHYARFGEAAVDADAVAILNEVRKRTRKL